MTGRQTVSWQCNDSYTIEIWEHVVCFKMCILKAEIQKVQVSLDMIEFSFWTLGTPRKTSHFHDLEKVSRLYTCSMLDSFPSFFWPSKFLSLLLIKQLMKFNIFVSLTFGTWYGFENCCQNVHKVIIHPHRLTFTLLTEVHIEHWLILVC